MANRFQNRGGVRRGRGPQRVAQWVGSADQGSVAVTAGAKVVIQSNALLENATIVRVRGQLTTFPTVASADLNIIGAYGIGIVSDEAFAAGAASIPGPWSNKDWGGWFVWLPISWRFEFISGVGVLQAGITSVIDSKAMRKIGLNETVVVVAESQGSAFDVMDPFRMLLKLA